MPRTTSTSTLTKLIAKLRADHKHHVDALATIQSVFAQLGISHEGGKRRGRPPGRSGGKTSASRTRRRKRKHFGENAETFVLNLLKGKELTTAQINKAWKKAGRGGVANNSLTTLAKQKKVKRSAVKGGRGSKYSVA